MVTDKENFNWLAAVVQCDNTRPTHDQIVLLILVRTAEFPQKR